MIPFLFAALALPPDVTADVPATPNPVAGMVRQALGESADEPFLLMVELEAKPNRGAGVIDAWRAAAAPTRKEPGNATYALHRDPGNPAKFVLWERWRSAAALDAHLETDYTKTLLSTWEPLLTGPPKVTVLRAVPAEVRMKKPPVAGGEKSGAVEGTRLPADRHLYGTTWVWGLKSGGEIIDGDQY